MLKSTFLGLLQLFYEHWLFMLTNIMVQVTVEGSFASWDWNFIFSFESWISESLRADLKKISLKSVDSTFGTPSCIFPWLDFSPSTLGSLLDWLCGRLAFNSFFFFLIFLAQDFLFYFILNTLRWIWHGLTFDSSKIGRKANNARVESDFFRCFYFKFGHQWLIFRSGP